MGDQKNLFLAIGLSVAIIVAAFLFVVDLVLNKLMNFIL